MAAKTAPRNVYDPRIREVVRAAGKPGLLPKLSIPRFTVAGWLRGTSSRQSGLKPVSKTEVELHARLAKEEACPRRTTRSEPDAVMRGVRGVGGVGSGPGEHAAVQHAERSGAQRHGLDHGPGEATGALPADGLAPAGCLEQGRGLARQELGGVGNGKAGWLARGLGHCPDSGALQLRLAQVADAASSHTRPGCA